MSEQPLNPAQQQGSAPLERLRKATGNGRLPAGARPGMEGMPPSKPAPDTAEPAACFAPPRATRLSVCLGEPLLAAIGFLFRAGVVVVGLAALVFVLLFLWRSLT